MKFKGAILSAGIGLFPNIENNSKYELNKNNQEDMQSIAIDKSSNLFFKNITTSTYYNSSFEIDNSITYSVNNFESTEAEDFRPSYFESKRKLLKDNFSFEIDNSITYSVNNFESTEAEDFRPSYFESKRKLLKDNFSKEYSKYSSYLSEANNEHAKKEINQLINSLSYINFDNGIVELLPQNSVKFTLQLNKVDFVMISKSVEDTFELNLAVMTKFSKGEYVSSNVGEIKEFVEEYKNQG